MPLRDTASDFFLSSHFEWSSAYQAKVLFLMTDRALGLSRPVGTTRGTGNVKFDNPAEAEFALIVQDAYAYVLVDDEDVGEYTLAQSRSLRGNLGLTVLSGTNKDYGTRCEMTNLHLWIPED